MTTATPCIVGFDCGSQKTLLIDQEGEILLTSTGGVTRPTLIAFSQGLRLFDEEASAISSGETMLSLMPCLAGVSLEEARYHTLIQFIHAYTHTRIHSYTHTLIHYIHSYTTYTT